MQLIPFPKSLKLRNRNTNKKDRLFPFMVVPITAILAGIFSYWGSSLRPVLVPNPLFAALVVGISVFLLLIPIAVSRRDFKSILSPEVMGALGYFIYISFGSITNHVWPGLAVNPSLFPELPLGIIAQTLGAIAFIVGARIGRNIGKTSPERRTSIFRLSIVLSIYALFTLYVSIFVPRVDEFQIRQLIQSGVSVSWLITAGPYIVMQTLPMLVASWYYLRGHRFIIPRYILTGIFAYAAFIFIVSGSRTYAIQSILMIFIAIIIANEKISKKLVLISISSVVIILLLGTTWRLSGQNTGSSNLTTLSFQDVHENIVTLPEQVEFIGINQVGEDIHANLVYHLSDNQTMAMLIHQSYRGLLLGRATLYSVMSGLPSGLRIFGQTTGTNEIVHHFRFYKEPTTDGSYWPDWQMTIGVLGFADFSIIGLILYPFIAGLIVKWIYNRTIITQGLGVAGWLFYIPIIQMLWSPTLMGPDSIQIWRFLLPLFVLLRWSTKK